jgi:uncharacterized membrane protein
MNPVALAAYTIAVIVGILELATVAKWWRAPAQSAPAYWPLSDRSYLRFQRARLPGAILAVSFATTGFWIMFFEEGRPLTVVAWLLIGVLLASLILHIAVYGTGTPAALVPPNLRADVSKGADSGA